MGHSRYHQPPLILFVALMIMGVLLILSGAWLLMNDLYPGALTQLAWRPAPSPIPRQAAADSTSASVSTPTETVATETETPATPTATLTATPVPNTAVPTRTPTHTVPPPPTQPSSGVNAKDQADIVFVPAGEFVMGSNSANDPYIWGAEVPQHTVAIDAYWIYRNEVTNAMYQACVTDKACPKPARYYSRTQQTYYADPAYANYPVIYVSWVSAAAYCHWAGGRLPTEAEWEKAARGTDGRLFPWGNNPPVNGQANLCDGNCPAAQRDASLDDGYADTAPIGSFTAGASPYGVLDMAGNVWEWVFDYFQSDYYRDSPDTNPRGPADGTRRVIRGGSWSNPVRGIRTVGRASMLPTDTLDTLGFRCALDVK